MAKGNRWTQSTTCKSNLSLTNILYCRIDHLFWIKVYYSLPTSSQTISLRTCVGSPGQRCVQKCWTHVRNSQKLPVSLDTALPYEKDLAAAPRALATTWGCLLPCERLATSSTSPLLILISAPPVPQAPVLPIEVHYKWRWHSPWMKWKSRVKCICIVLLAGTTATYEAQNLDYRLLQPQMILIRWGDRVCSFNQIKPQIFYCNPTSILLHDKLLY